MSASNPMSIANFTKAAEALPCSISVLLRADHGLGKSQVVRQLRVNLMNQVKKDEVELGPFPLIDKRLAQLTEGDMIGLPSTDGECTRFNPPDWYKKACKEPCVLFLDELNRATPEVMQAAFQIVLDRELNGWKLHPLTRVYSAVNTGAGYSVNEIDPALLDRFFVTDLVPTIKDWLEWSAAECLLEDSPKFGKRNVAPLITEFIRTEEKWLDTPQNADPSRCHPSRRSWERISDILEHADLLESPNSQLFYLLTMGMIGVEGAIKFRDFAVNIDMKVTGKEILEKYHTKAVKRKCDMQGQEGKNACLEKLADYVVENCEKLTARQGNNLKAFMENLPGELRIACWSRLTKDGLDKLELAKSVHKYCAKTMLEVFGVPMGEAGIGVVPNIPSTLQEKKEETKKK